MIMRRSYLTNDDLPEYFFFTEQEWKEALQDGTTADAHWDNKYALLPLDKASWH